MDTSVILSRVLRKRTTPEEQKLWELLRDKRFSNCKFRRQVALGSYVVDFCCFSRKLIIEIDGANHRSFDSRRQDKIREKYLHNQGYVVIRFWNNEVNTKFGYVKEKIRLYLIIYPSSALRAPSPTRGEE